MLMILEHIVIIFIFWLLIGNVEMKIKKTNTILEEIRDLLKENKVNK